MKTKNSFYSIWATFDNKNQIYLQKIKKKINKKLKGPNFPIHITLSSGFAGTEKNITEKIIPALFKSGQFYIDTNKYGYKNTFFQSLYVNVKKNKDLISKKKIIDNILNCKKKSFYPHISLYYGLKNNAVKKQVISKLPELKKKIKVTNLCIAINNEKKLKWKIVKKILI
tara:strand:+ start:54 stop:563 length:510 start_codon:yes stop_codon:yes gene_type:complete